MGNASPDPKTFLIFLALFAAVLRELSGLRFFSPPRKKPFTAKVAKRSPRSTLRTPEDGKSFFCRNLPVVIF
jgi:hypothetical protein